MNTTQFTIPAELCRQVAGHPYPLLFATISGGHLYGFPSPDSDFDLRGVHLLPLKDLVGLADGAETVEKSGVHNGLEIDLVTHDAKKFFGLMLKKNGYVLEQLLSPLVVATSSEHEELKALASGCITKPRMEWNPQLRSAHLRSARFELVRSEDSSEDFASDL